MESGQRLRHALSILIVEDEKLAHASMRLVITAKFPGVVIHFAENGVQGVELFREHSPDIVITDIFMPGMDGIEMAGEIKSLKRDTKFIVLTGFGDKLEEFSKIGFVDYIVKPVEFHKLFAAIEKCVSEIGNSERTTGGDDALMGGR